MMADHLAIDFRSLLRAERRRRAQDETRDKASSARNRKEGEAMSPPRDTPDHHRRARGRSGTKSTEGAVVGGQEGWTLGSAPPPSLAPSEHAIPSTVESVYYVPNFLSDEFGARLRDWLQSLPERTTDGGGWTRLKHARRRVALFDGRTQDRRLPPPLLAVAAALVESGAFPPSTPPPNHVLVNEYRPGEGILPHTDGPSYVDRTATVSIGGDAILKFRRRLRTDEIGSASQVGDGLDVLLSGAGSLVVFAGDAYMGYCHSIDEVEAETTSERCGNAAAGLIVTREGRISLTFRHKLLDAE